MAKMDLTKAELPIKKIEITLIVLDKNGRPIKKQIITKKNNIITSRKEDINGPD